MAFYIRRSSHSREGTELEADERSGHFMFFSAVGLRNFFLHILEYNLLYLI